MGEASISSHLINQEKYNETVTLFWSKWQPKEPSQCHKYRSIYAFCSNVAGHCLHCFCDGVYEVVPTYKNVFDVILEVLSKGGHAKGTAGHYMSNIKYCFLYHVLYFIET